MATIGQWRNISCGRLFTMSWPTFASIAISASGDSCHPLDEFKNNDDYPMPELIAYHEAGHALMAVLLGGKVKQVTIEPDDDDGPARQGDTQVYWRRSG